MPVDQNAPLRITTLDQVPDFARGHVRDIRVRWACEEIGLAYATRPVSALDRPTDYYARQPWGQVPAIEDGDLDMFESGAILLHLGERDERLLPRDRKERARAVSWLFAAYSSVEPLLMELASVDIFNAGERWATLRRPGLLDAIGQRLDLLQAALGEREWLAGRFSIADIAMVTVLRGSQDTDLLASRPGLADYLQRGVSRPAFGKALQAQLDDFAPEPGTAAESPAPVHIQSPSPAA